jgi:hypothetical protein
MAPDDENDVIRYVMEEMDPSEEVLMERAMMEDDDLLIEVESMRHTMQRLNDLPEKEPPAELTQSIVREAKTHQKHRRGWADVSPNMYKYAAVLMIGICLGGGMWFFMNFYFGQRGNVRQATATISTQRLPVKPQVKPWVDRHDIIYFQDKFSEKSGYQSIQQASLHKLTPVQQPAVNSYSTSPNVHLTSEERP